ncbi:MAG: hypothetical protein CM15mP44_4240 [Candidatus Neomarinimicrobiota bacterium]|nr:MAG: hypothetical protein CM15mP44_4240 [Candidatus Neomarinimicrobiota bacterium]
MVFIIFNFFYTYLYIVYLKNIFIYFYHTLVFLKKIINRKIMLKDEKRYDFYLRKMEKFN